MGKPTIEKLDTYRRMGYNPIQEDIPYKGSAGYREKP
jgi:hypothetical protein